MSASTLVFIVFSWVRVRVRSTMHIVLRSFCSTVSISMCFTFVMCLWLWRARQECQFEIFDSIWLSYFVYNSWFSACDAVSGSEKETHRGMLTSSNELNIRRFCLQSTIVGSKCGLCGDKHWFWNFNRHKQTNEQKHSISSFFLRFTDEYLICSKCE